MSFSLAFIVEDFSFSWVFICFRVSLALCYYYMYMMYNTIQRPVTQSQKHPPEGKKKTVNIIFTLRFRFWLSFTSLWPLVWHRRGCLVLTLVLLSSVSNVSFGFTVIHAYSRHCITLCHCWQSWKLTVYFVNQDLRLNFQVSEMRMWKFSVQEFYCVHSCVC